DEDSGDESFNTPIEVSGFFTSRFIKWHQPGKIRVRYRTAESALGQIAGDLLRANSFARDLFLRLRPVGLALRGFTYINQLSADSGTARRFVRSDNLDITDARITASTASSKVVRRFEPRSLDESNDDIANAGLNLNGNFLESLHDLRAPVAGFEVVQHE